ncbi:(2Fe-2S)-binding protein [Ammoniphilus sp. CFH 90114]|uniref:(2Fe-2S)-binding protein n=1 Tax=Ammoniphilus sp. CFH 90114 TaxID=2493665 RepID=UPI001F0CAA40|nr:(2Fe-2S)-binding protein [Ammoniphilus sp. CFH 90114]
MIKFRVNNQPVSVAAHPAKPLLDVLREELELTGSKECCGKGECGSCSVILNGEVVCSCLILVGQVEGEDVLTVEGIGNPECLDPIQESFIECGATQCGYCTPGIIVAARSYLDHLQQPPTQEEIKDALAGNLCRCTGYTKIIEAVHHAAQKQWVNK